MKRTMRFLLSICMLFTMTACTSQTAPTALAADKLFHVNTVSPTNESALPAEDKTSSATVSDSDDGRMLVAYFSCTGTTEQIAGWIADQSRADLYEITPEIPYTSADLNYGNSSSRTTAEQNNPSARPAISGTVLNIEEYDTVFLGYPIWHGQAPRIISTFLESYDFSGKTIVPFCSSHSSSIGSSDTNLHRLYPNTVTWLEGERFSAESSKEIVKEWVEDLNFANSTGSGLLSILIRLAQLSCAISGTSACYPASRNSANCIIR